MNTSDKSVKAQSISILCSILKRRRLHHRYLVYVYSNQTTGFRGWGQAGTWKSKECLQFVIYRTWVRANLSAVIPKMVVKKMYPHLISNSVSMTFGLFYGCLISQAPNSQLIGFCWHCGWLRLTRTFPQVRHRSDCHFFFIVWKVKKYSWPTGCRQHNLHSAHSIVFTARCPYVEQRTWVWQLIELITEQFLERRLTMPHSALSLPLRLQARALLSRCNSLDLWQNNKEVAVGSSSKPSAVAISSPSSTD